MDAWSRRPARSSLCRCRRRRRARGACGSPRISVSSICDQAANSAEASYREQAPPVATGAVVQGASYTLTTRQTAVLEAAKPQAIANCERKLNALQAGWSSLRRPNC